MAYMKHPKLARKKGESMEKYNLRRKRDRAERRAQAKRTTHLTEPLKIIHPWVADRDIHEPHIVLRIDDYSKHPADRGQFYPAVERGDDKMKAIWPTRGLAIDAAEWAAAKYGRQYGVFKMTSIVETAVNPVKVWEL